MINCDNNSEALDLKKNVAVLAVLSFAYYIATPLAGDIYVFLGSAHLAEIQYGGGLKGAILSWELKLLANRVFIYIMYKLTQFFVSFENKEVFLFTIKALNSILLFTSSWCLTNVLAKKYKLLSSNRLDAFFLLSSLLFFSTFSVVLQAEHTCLLISLIALYFLLSDRKLGVAVGIVLLSIIPFFKAITIIFSLQTLVILFGFFDVSTKWLLKIILCFIITSLIVGLVIAVVYPQEIVDLRNAAVFQSSFELNLVTLMYALFEGAFKLLINFMFYPFLPFALIVLIAYINDRTSIVNKRIISVISAWVVGFGAIVIQHKYFVYHYANLGLPLIFSVTMLYELKSNVRKNILGVSILSTAFFIVLFILVNSPLQTLFSLKFSQANKYGYIITTTMRYVEKWSYGEVRRENEDIQKIIDFVQTLNLNREQSVLYLDAGIGEWSFGMKSASRYYVPLPIQKSIENPNLMNTKVYNEYIDLMNNYNGEYVFLDNSWLDISDPRFDEFRKILDNYEKISIDGTKMDLYRKKQ